MSSKVILRKAIRSGFVLSVLMTTYACNFNKPETKSNNLKFVQCNPDGITVPVTAPGSVPFEYEFIFVCAGNDVEWVTDDASFTFTIDFDPSANDLFESGKTHFDSKPDPTGKHKHAIKGQKVSNHAKTLFDHPYTIKATDKTGKPVPTSDPHVIPM